MKSFEYAAPKELEDATALLGNQWGEAEILAGGTDLVTCLKQGLTAPARVVSLRNIKELRGINVDSERVRLGATATLAEIAANKDLRRLFPALITAIEGINAPQILSVGTLGGDLCQRPRCWYYRNGFGLLARQDNTSLAREGDNRYHAVFGTDGPALFVSASSLGPVLSALGAEVVITGPGGKTRKVAVDKFFRTPASEGERETALKPNEILSEVQIASLGTRNATYEVRHRHGLDWPYVTATVAYQVKDGKAADARVFLGHVAPVPWAAGAAARALTGNDINEAVATRAGEAAVEGAQPLSGNAYKLQMIKAAVKRAALAAAAAKA